MQQLLTRPAHAPAVVVGVIGTEIVASPLVQSVEECQRVAKLIGEGKYEQAMALRGRDFAKDFETLKKVNCVSETLEESESLRHQFDMERDESKACERGCLLVMHTGAPCAGMNSAARAAVRLALDRGSCVVGCLDGFLGLAQGRVKALKWMDVDTWANMGGCALGTNRVIPGTTEAPMENIARTLREHNVTALFNIGGFEAFTGLRALAAARDTYPALCIPMTCLPATISNNVPGTECALGTDTALNAIVGAVDVLKQSASGTRRRMFIVETHGNNCGMRDGKRGENNP